MALTSDTSQKISMYDICDEFGQPRNTPLSAFYRGGGIVPDSPSNSGVPTAGNPISIQDFYGAAAVFNISTVLSGRYNQIDLFGYLQANTGWDGSTPIEGSITISGTCYSNSTSNAALIVDRSAIPNGSGTIEIQIDGDVRGAGGRGGDAINTQDTQVAIDGGDGGPGLIIFGSTNASLEFYNQNGSIAGGGGGGGSQIVTEQSGQVRLAAGGGGGAGDIIGTGGQATSSTNGTGDGSDGTTTLGGDGGEASQSGSGTSGGDGGNRGQDGQVAPQTTGGSISGAGQAGYSIQGYLASQWPSGRGTIYGPWI